MKYIKFLGWTCLMALASFVTACDDDDPAIDFGLDKKTLEVPAEGATQEVRVTASSAWIASTEQPWILISPANGDRSSICKIRIDSTYQDIMRNGEIRFTCDGRTLVTKVNQAGFPKQILVDGAENGVCAVNIPDYIENGKNYFDVNLTTNVDFRIQIENTTVNPDGVDAETSTSWLKYDRYQVPLVQSKPRKVKIRFKWDYNTKWWKQTAKINFVPKNAEGVGRCESVLVSQQEAPKITDDRAGDSIAVLSIARQLNIYGSFDPSKNMEEWGENLELYTEADGLDKDGKLLAGRVKYVRFYFMDCNVSLPFEVRYLTRAEHISFFSNTNSQLKQLKMGKSLQELAKYGYLKKLEIFAYGLTELPYDFICLGKSGPKGEDGLEELSLSNNNLTTFPEILTKENFPKLKRLNLIGNRLHSVHDLSNSIYDGKEGLTGELPRHLFEWDTLEELELSYNYFTGTIPDMLDYPIKWTAADGYSELVGKPKVLPNMKHLKLNLNRLTGELPEWLLHHPNIEEWDPYSLIFLQEGKDRNGKSAGFTNEPDHLTPPVKDGDK